MPEHSKNTIRTFTVKTMNMWIHARVLSDMYSHIHVWYVVFKGAWWSVRARAVLMDFMPDIVRMAGTTASHTHIFSFKTKPSFPENLYLKWKYVGQTHTTDQLSSGNELHELPCVSVCVCPSVCLFDRLCHTVRISRCVVSVLCAYIYFRKMDGEEWHTMTKLRERKTVRERDKKETERGWLWCYSAFRLSSTHNPVPWGGGDSWDWQSSEGWTRHSTHKRMHTHTQLLMILLCNYGWSCSIQ